MNLGNQLSIILLDQLAKGEKYINSLDEELFCQKPNQAKWSKKEILGHLIDSAINNLQRFTTVRYEEKPFPIHPYKQDELVKANNYQEADTQHLLSLWLSLNHRIDQVFDLLDESEFSYEIILPDGKKSDVKFLAEDYVDHLANHLGQIMK